nr:DUF3667 domain-containing protein [uncultured Flavobacterium sp.]
MEKGILFTIKESITRPGKAALDYIGGKRIRYYNIFYLILLLIGLNLFLNHQYNEVLNEPYIVSTDVAGNKIEDFMTANAKGMTLSFIPLFALSSFLFFRRKKLNSSEHFIIAGMTFLGILISIIISNCFAFLDFTDHFKTIGWLINSYLLPFVFLFQIIYSYYLAFSNDYTRIGFAYRMLLFLLFLLTELIILLVLIYGYSTNWIF